MMQATLHPLRTLCLAAAFALAGCAALPVPVAVIEPKAGEHSALEAMKIDRALEDRIDHIRRCFRKGSMPGQFGNAGHGVENETLFGYWWCVGHISLYRWLA